MLHKALRSFLVSLVLLLVAAIPARAAFLCDNAWMSTATTGTGTLTLGSAQSGAQSFASCGITNGQSVRYRIFDGANWEVGSGTYTSAGTTLSRTVTASSNAGSAINLSGSATVIVTALTADLPSESTPTDTSISTSSQLFSLEGGVLSRYPWTNTVTALAGPGMANASGALVQSMARSVKTAGYTLVAADRGSTISVQTNSVTLSVTAAATLGNGWWAIVRNDNTAGSTNTMVIDPNASETVDGLTTLTDYSGAARILYTDGSAFYTHLMQGGTVDIQTFLSSGTWTKPAVGYLTWAKCWGGGGSGGKGTTADAAHGGGGGGFQQRWFNTSDLGATETVTIGAGGASQTTASTVGNDGGNTTFGSWLTAYGGGGGGGYSSSFGGGAGGAFGKGVNGNTSGVGGDYPSGNSYSPTAGETSTLVGWGGRNNASTTAYPPGNGTSETSGGGGGATNTGAAGNVTAGGNAINGGGGGGAGAEDSSPGPSAGGTSLSGGNGGAGAYDANNATAGSQPGGGGGGSETGNSGAGGNGKCEILTFR